MNLLTNPLFEALKDSQSILLAGAGGGFDIYSGLPLYFALRDAGKTVHLANFSFALLPDDPETEICPACVRVHADSPGSDHYFPERTLSRWFREARGEEVDVYGFVRCGVVRLREGYECLRQRLALDAIVLVDGGTDSLMCGDEVGLGTPAEDIVSIAAVNGIDVPVKLLASIGFGVDHYHGVCHAQWFEAVAALTRAGGYLGTLTVLPQMAEAQLFLDAVAHANRHTPDRPSIVSNSIAAAVVGQFGDHHATNRTYGSELWINPLMPIYWSFTVESVYKRNLYVRAIEHTEIMSEVAKAIAWFRDHRPAREWQPIPYSRPPFGH